MRSRARFVTIAAMLCALGASPSALPTITIVAQPSDDGTPVVRDIINHRVPTLPLVLQIVVNPAGAAYPDTLVKWSSPDGKNEFGEPSIEMRSAPGTYATNIGARVAIFRHRGTSGDAIIVADIGEPLNIRKTIAVRDVVNIGIGTEGLGSSIPFVRIVAGEPSAATAAEADIASTGGHLCFAHGARVVHADIPGPFQNELSFADVSDSGVIDVRTADGTIYRLHLHAKGSTYLEGSIESTPVK